MPRPSLLAAYKAPRFFPISGEYFGLTHRHKGMKHKLSSIKLAVGAIISALFLANCTTTYDSYGRPVQSVDPVAAAVGAVALGAVAYSVGKNNRHKSYYTPSHYRHRGHSYHRGHHGHRRHR